ncbi:ATP-dependent DNA ligase [Promicromonospora sukumoe]|uniref:Probable DNA ligase n=1 Tax=Promicromonospora sukumoe TaxID=88382 RepID=A0A7W3J569_9MICO|nr:ATP-dependent DNA ligase [Promicromonospora sukumoe]MBA8806500.1 DNA ligase-1 [Promicromonospora sukumoe]
MLLAEVAATSDAVAATRSRLAKRAAIADLLRRTADGADGVGGAAPSEAVTSDPADAPGRAGDLEIVVAYLAGALRQRRTGLGYAALRDLPPPAVDSTLTVRDVDAAFDAMAALEGPGSAQARSTAAAELFGAATEREQAFLRGLVAGELRQGALDSVVVDAVAEAAGTPADAVRRAVMLRGATGPVASAALLADDPLAALADFTLEVGRPVRPMLAASAPDIAAAFEKLGSGDEPVELCVDVKLDGIRIQVHRLGDEVRVVTRSLDDITERVPEIVEAVRALPSDRLVLDGEALGVGPDGVPRPFQETASRSATHEPGRGSARGPGRATSAEEALADQFQLTPFFFDVLHADGRDLLDAPLRERLTVLDEVAGAHTVRRLRTSDPEAAAEFFAGALREGQEGVVVKSLDTPYAAGRRGAGWVKVKPRKTLDLVVLAVERGSGRRQGWLSNIHLGARDPEGGFVMLGKTFKGMTDEMLQWQTERFRELEVEDNGWVVTVRPEQVVEIAFDGLQRSTRYRGGLALRFARVLRYRDDKTAAEADTIDTVRALAV